jgi:hypothetical protein|tara:strand:+ start:153 stop:443 length:291 start_codon:yes stop_codon:yes gene_type:complete
MSRDFDKELDDAQNEYYSILCDVFSHDKDLVEKDKGYIYWWERLKVLQKNIVILSFDERERALEKAREALEEAFTPRIKKMLKDIVVDEEGTKGKK